MRDVARRRALTDHSTRPVPIIAVTWLAVFLVSLLPWRRAPWGPMLLVAAVAFAALPLADAEAYRNGEIASYDRVFLGFDVAVATIGYAFAAIAEKLREEHTNEKILDQAPEKELVS